MSIIDNNNNQSSCKVTVASVTINAWISEGQKLRTLRVGLEISQGALARQMGVSTMLISRFERGLRVKRRKFVVNSYLTALKLLSYQKMDGAKNIFDYIQNF